MSEKLDPKKADLVDKLLDVGVEFYQAIDSVNQQFDEKLKAEKTETKKTKK